MTGKRTGSDVLQFLYARAVRDEASGCLEWTGHLSPKGYGRLNKVGAGSVQAHRASYIAHFGSIPDDALVCHRCDNRKCIEPSHLFLGTAADNNRDRDLKGRQHVIHSEDVVREIKRRVASGELQRSVASKMAVRQGTVSRIVNGVRRANVQ